MFGNTYEKKADVLIFMKLREVRNRLFEENINMTTPASGASQDMESQACQGSGRDMRCWSLLCEIYHHTFVW